MEYQTRWWQLAAVQIGGAVCLPVFVLGHALAVNYGLISALIAVAAGNLILMLLGMAAAYYASKTRLTTPESAEDALGAYGKPFFAFVLIVSMVGWFAVQLDIMGSLAGNLMGISFAKPLNVILGGLITLLSFRGIKGMEMLANICLPLMILTIGYAVFEVSQNTLKPIDEDFLVLGGITLALAGGMAAVIDLPTFFRSAVNTKEAIIASLLLFGFALPLIEGVGIYLAVHGAQDNLVASLANEHSSLLWKGWIAIFIIIAGWTTNSANLYSAVISMKTAFKFKESTCQLALGVLGTIISLFSIQENLFLFLECIGILLAAGGGVMVLNQVLLGRTAKQFNAFGLAFGVLIGMLSLFGFEISGSGFIDAFLAAFSAAFVGIIVNKGRVYETS